MQLRQLKNVTQVFLQGLHFSIAMQPGNSSRGDEISPKMLIYRLSARKYEKEDSSQHTYH